ncbi:diacylglycerol kinase family protein [Massilia atriviolacea]|uniref:Diacylglycerol kinase family protein n=1 Tax=Massilia atriviolacea TaxID=2495579 RepID=A0A430HT54_9BURK|nr:diacylglycerol kinase family protein [Massilia atriviolacea]RSZ60677.1 diacylglycerol kinase family protein [Massilia atriviolacea]
MNETKNVGTPQRFSLAARSKSFGYAIAGIAFMLKTQHNAWLHLAASVIVVGLGLYFNVSSADWRWLVAAMVAVWVAETINTAVEYVCDVVSPGYAIAVKHAKDIGAGGVLIAAAGAVLIGALTFWPYLQNG